MAFSIYLKELGGVANPWLKGAFRLLVFSFKAFSRMIDIKRWRWRCPNMVLVIVRRWTTKANMDTGACAEIQSRSNSPLYHILCTLYKLRGLFEVGML
jgi:hypothetical protein